MWKMQAIHIPDWPHSQRSLRFFTLILRQYNEQTIIGLPMKNSCYLVGSATVQLFSKRRAIKSSRIWLRGGNWIWEEATQCMLCQSTEAISIHRCGGVDVHYISFSYLSPLSAGVVSMIELLIIDNESASYL